VNNMTKTRRKIDYKKELESASRSMIMVHEPALLIRLIIRMIVQKVHIKHAGMILFNPEKGTYILSISKGERGMKIPEGFARFDKKHPIIRLFSEKEYAALIMKKSAVLTQDLNTMIWQESIFNGKNGGQGLLHQVSSQMRMFNVEALVPAKYKDILMAVLLLGEKRDGTRFEPNELDFFAALASDVAMAIRNAQLFDDLRKESEKYHNLFLRTVIVLGRAIEAKDKYTHGHTERVTDYCVQVARQMMDNGSAEFPDNFFDSLYIAALLHDIGKIGISETILHKASKLSEGENELMQQHPLAGAEILKDLSELKESLDGIKYHHERYDGKGYPYKLKGDDIPYIAAIISVADAFDAMMTDRPYRKALSKEEALEEIKKHSGTQFHPKPAKALVELVEMGRI